jgi:hypothetical protein
MILNRRLMISGLASLPALLPGLPLGARIAAREITWDDLIPEGVPYSMIIGQGSYDEANDIWLPEFDENANRFVEALNGEMIRMPGYMLPLDTGGDGVREFILTPYVGACVHVPPPPPNQLVFVETETPWPAQAMFEAIWVTGTIRVSPLSTNLAEIGYSLTAELIEPFEW